MAPLWSSFMDTAYWPVKELMVVATSPLIICTTQQDFTNRTTTNTTNASLKGMAFHPLAIASGPPQMKMGDGGQIWTRIILPPKISLVWICSRYGPHVVVSFWPRLSPIVWFTFVCFMAPILFGCGPYLATRWGPSHSPLIHDARELDHNRAWDLGKNNFSPLQ